MIIESTSHHTMASTIVQYATTHLHCSSIPCFRNNFRINHNKTQLSLNLAYDNNSSPTKETSKQSNRFEKRLTSSLRVRDIVDRIKALPSNERSDVIISWVESSDFGSISKFNDLLLALLFVDESDLALKLFDDMPCHGLVPDSWTLSISIRCYCKNEDFNEAEGVLGHMLENGLHPNYATIALLVNLLSLSGRVQRALSVLDVVGRVGFKPRVQTYNCLLKGLCYVGRIEEAMGMLMRMKESSEKPDIYSYTAVMNGLCKVGKSNEAFELLGEALVRGLKPDAVAFNTLLNGYCLEARPMEGIGVLNMMRERDCVPDHISYTTLLHGLLKWGHSKQALKVYEEMVGIGLKVEDKLVNTLLRGLCWISREGQQKVYFENAYRLFLKFKYCGSVIDPSTYDVMIRTLCVWKRTYEASVDLQSMIRMGYAPRMVTFNGVIRALCLEGKASEALVVLFLLNEGGRVPSGICYELLIHQLNQQRSPLAACSLYGAALKHGVVPSKILQQ